MAFWLQKVLLGHLSNVLVAKKQLLRPKTPEPHPGSGARAGMPKPDPKSRQSNVWCPFSLFGFQSMYAHKIIFFFRWAILDIFEKRFDFSRGLILCYLIFGGSAYIYEVESRAGYPEMSDQSTFWGFFIYILLLNVKQLLSIVWRRPTRHFKADDPYFSTENFWRV